MCVTYSSFKEIWMSKPAATIYPNKELGRRVVEEDL
jgi:hypothetical protein